ncbi:MAG: hypothetical protein GY772_24255 [bacterium]|nr:hypothetical protein [bacterium]
MIGRRRLEALDLVLDKDPEKLRGTIAVWKGPQSVGESPSKATAPGLKPADKMQSLGLAPPRPQYAQLMTLDDLEKTIETVWDCEDAADVRNKRKAFTSAKAPVTDLVTACKKAAADFAKVHKATTKEATASRRLAVPAPRPGLGIRDIFEHGPSLGQEVPVRTEGDVDDFAFERPLVVRSLPVEHETFSKEGQVRAFTDTFTGSFTKDATRLNLSRAQLRCVAGVSDLVLARVARAFPSCAWAPCGKPECAQLDTSAHPALFAVAKNTETLAVERDYLPVLSSSLLSCCSAVLLYCFIATVC